MDRLEMNLRQPQSMVNYTTLGFEKVKVPKKVFNVLKKFWEANMGTEEVEEWNHGNTYTNHVSGRCVLVGYLFVAYDVIEY